MCKNLLTITGSKILAMSLVEKVATDVLRKDWSSLSAVEIDSLSKRIGKAMKELFTNPAMHKTRKLGPRNLQKKYYVGVMLI